MRFSPLLLTPLSGLLLLACGPAGNVGSETEGSLALTSGSSGSNARVGTDPTQVEVPEFLYPEDQLISLESEVHLRNGVGDLVRVKEVLLADGQGNSRLDIVGKSQDLVQPFGPPSSQLLLDYQARMRFLIGYRNPHLRAFNGVASNFTWTEDPVLIQVAGIDCKRFTATSEHEMGDVEFLVDSQSGLVLAWTLFQANGEIGIQSTATAVNYSPSLTGVVWSAPVVMDQQYVDAQDQPLLGFAPQDPRYLPPGFYLEESWLRFSAGLFPGMSDMLVRIYSDGIHLVFVAQHDQQLYGNQMQIADKLTEVNQLDLGGVRVAEGNVAKRKYYVASMLSLEEIQTIFGSLLD
jgi:hypothetical protein